MDNRYKKCCPNCCQPYILKAVSSKKDHGNLPHFLSCGHTMCENCVRNIIKFAEPIECKVCHKDMTISTEDVAAIEEKRMKLHHIFPINYYILGELAHDYIEPEVPKVEDDQCFIDLDSVIKNAELSQGQCMECNSTTKTMCKHCKMVLCGKCFNKSHKNFIIFKNHVLQNIEFEFENIGSNTCKAHMDKPLDFYCKTCAQPICMVCFMVGGEKSCKSHDVVSIQEVNENFITELNELNPKIEELFKRLTKTAVDIGHELMNMQNETGSADLTTILNDVEQKYSKLISNIKEHKDEITRTIIQKKSSEKESLLQVKNCVEEGLTKTKKFINLLNTLDLKQIKQANIHVLLEDAKNIMQLPWYLNKDQKDEDLKIMTNEEICNTVKDYIKLEGTSNSMYKLCNTSDLEKENIEIPAPPTAPVHPPKMVTDVRQKKEPQKPLTLYEKAPKYRSKTHGSCSSLNSTTSDSTQDSRTSYKNYYKPAVQPVPPFPESQFPKLQEGSQELIYISHIVDPHNFFVQRACQQPRVDEILREFRNALSLPQPSLNHVAEGKVYLVRNQSDNLWLRCRIVSIDRKNPNKPEFHVFCIDFGGSEIVTIDKLRLLPPVRVHSPPPFAINCSLANCQPKNGSWTIDDAILIQNIIDNKQAIIHVRGIRSTSPNSVTLDVDVTTFEHGVSVAHALVFHSRAIMPNKLQYPKLPDLVEKPKIFESNNSYKSNTTEEVIITHVNGPDSFYVRTYNLQHDYEDLCRKLEESYSANNKNHSIYLPEKDMVCVVNVEKEGFDCKWMRARVTELPGRARVRVRLLDSGHVLLVHWSALRRIHRHFTRLRALATECHLSGITPSNKKWSPASVTLLKNYENRQLRAHIVEQKKSLAVVLYDMDDENESICINQLMIQHRFAFSIGPVNFNKTVEPNIHINWKTSSFPEKKPEILSKPKTDTNIQKPKSKYIPSDDECLDTTDKGPLRLEVKVLNYQSPSILYVSLIQQQKAYNELFEKIQKFYSNHNEKPKKDWTVGDRCCALCLQSKTWRRAVILKLTENIAEVFYSDFASAESVPTENLREMPQEIKSVGDGAILCHLFGIKPAAGEKWASVSVDYLRDLIDEYQRVFITKTGKFKGKSMPIELWVYHTIPGGALDPDISEWRCLNKKIIEQGLALPDDSEKIASGSQEPKNSEDSLSFLNLPGSVRDWVQFEPLPTKPLNLHPESASDSPVQEIDKTSTADNSNTVLISDWLPPEPLQCKEFVAMPTYIDNDGVVYLHNIAQQDTLDLMRKALDVRFKNPDPKAKYAKWSVGEPCVALYFLDNRFYRGRVLEVNKEASTCLIHYIDYGNEEICTFENLRKSIALYEIPTQAHKCVLSRIKPINDQWDRETLDYIHKSIVEKECLVKILGETVNGETPVDIKIDKLWISDHLVNFELAQYTDGSKAVVRKFVPRVKTPELQYEVIESDSGPDYIVEDDNLDKSNNMKMEDLIGKDWNELIEEEQNNSPTEDFNFVTFPKNTEDEFSCTIAEIKGVDMFELSVNFDEEKDAIYEQMFAELQKDGENMNPLNGIFKNKACVALFPKDAKWYRATILQYSQEKGLIKVKSVDYGHECVVPLSDVREITEEYLELPPATVFAKLHNVNVNPDLDRKSVINEIYELVTKTDTVYAKVMEYDDELPCVEIRDDNNQLVYESLFEKKIYLKTP